MFSRLHYKRNIHLTAYAYSRNTTKRSSFQIKEELAEFLQDSSSSDLSNLTSRLRDEQYRHVVFRDLIDQRRDEARRSLFVQVRSENSADSLSHYCAENFGKVKALHFHKNANDKAFTNFFIVEFEKEESVDEAIYSHCQHKKNGSLGSSTIPVYSPFMWFTVKNGSNTEEKSNADSSSTVPVFMPEKTVTNEEEFVKHMMQFPTLDDQMVAFHSLNKLTSMSNRIRFLACHQIELAIRGLFAKAEVLPFGSSVNSFGKKNSDLDMIVNFDCCDKMNDSRLVFHAKGANHGGLRFQSQHYCDQFASILQHFLPGCQDVQNIAHARVPIVKYYQQLLGLECDLSVSSLSGFYMSEILYLYGELDWRVRPLIFTIRQWAKDQHLIHDSRPTPSFTNFTLLLMVIFFLQKKYQMLPPLQVLQRLARPEDDIVGDNGLQFKFLRDISGLQPSLNPYFNDTDLTLTQMLVDFFEFYSRDFSYDRDAVCIITGDIQPKRRHDDLRSPNRNVRYFLDITNPLEPDLNVSGNVQDHAVKKFKLKCEETLTKLWRLQDDASITTLPKLLFVFSTQVVKSLNFRVQDLGSLENTSAAEQKMFSKVLSDSEISPNKGLYSEDKLVCLDEKQKEEILRKRNLRSPKIKDFFRP